MENVKNSELDLKKLIKRASFWFLVSIMLGGVSAVFLVLQFIVLAHVIDNLLFRHALMDSQYTNILYIILCFIFQISTRLLSDISGTKAGIKIAASLRSDLYARLYSTGPIAYKNLPIGEMVNSLTEGIDNLIPYFARYIPSAAMMVILPIFILAVVADVDFWSFVVLACTGPLIPVFMAFVGYSAQVIMDKQWRQLSILSGSFLDMLKGLKTLRLFGRANESLSYIEKLSDEYRKTTLSVMKVAFLTSAVLEFFSSLSIAVIAVIFGSRLLAGTVDFRDAFLVLLLAPEYFMPLRNFSASYHARQNANAALDQLKKLYELPKLIMRSAYVPNDRCVEKITLDQVTVQSTEEQNLLDNISCSFVRDQLSVVIGQSGAGKTSLLNMLLGFLTISSGKLSIFDTHGLEMKLEEMRIAWVPQKPYMIFGSIKENLCLGSQKISMDRLKEATQQAGILSFIEQLPKGFETHVGEGGKQFSGGQLRRFILARALLRNPDILILDEPTSGLDQENALKIIQTIRECKKDRVVIVATHNTELTAQNDALFRIDHGKLIEQSTGKEL